MTGQALSGHRIVVLGGTGGLGHEVTARFRDDGASVVVADARPPRDDRRHEGVEYVTTDVFDEASVAAAFATSPPPQAIVNLIAHTTTRTGLIVKAALDTHHYDTAIRVSDADLARLDLTPHAFHGDWNYTISPRRNTS